MKDEKVKRNFAYRTEHSPRRHDSPTFMEFVHRLEERQESQEHEKKGSQPYHQHIEIKNHFSSDSILQGTLSTVPASLINLADLLLAGTLISLFIIMLLLVMN
ncbi:hypothetical protein [Kluyvera sichuanensis]|uniref:hypothetical protein n=1 Tax=Kluyvera sichuanensis TaxID=2725494 RepID=UPI0039F5BC00